MFLWSWFWSWNTTFWSWCCLDAGQHVLHDISVYDWLNFSRYLNNDMPKPITSLSTLSVYYYKRTWFFHILRYVAAGIRWSWSPAWALPSWWPNTSWTFCWQRRQLVWVYIVKQSPRSQPPTRCLTRLITNTIFETAVTIAHCVLKQMRKTFLKIHIRLVDYYYYT